MNSKQLIVFVPHYYYPPNFGGAVRVYEILRRLSNYFNLVIFSLDKIKRKQPIKTTYTLLWDSKKEFHRIISISYFIIKYAKRKGIKHFIIEYTTIPSAIFAILLKILYPHAIIIIDAHNVEYISKKGRWPAFLLPIAFLLEFLVVHLAYVLLTVSHFDKKIFRKVFHVRRPIIVIPNGVDIKEFAMAYEDEEIKKHKPCVVFHGWYYYKFNKEAFDIIIRQIAPKLPEVTFVLFGKETENILKEYKRLSSNVIILGTVPKERIPKILKACDLAVVPLYWGAGTSIKVIEYIAAGLTIIATPMAVRGLNLKPNREYYVAKNKDEFVEKIRYALNNKIDKNNLLNIAKYYDWTANVYKIKKIIEKLINL